MNYLRRNLHLLAHGLVYALIVGGLAGADYYGYSVIGENAEQQRPGNTTHLMNARFHK